MSGPVFKTRSSEVVVGRYGDLPEVFHCTNVLGGKSCFAKKGTLVRDVIVRIANHGSKFPFPERFQGRRDAFLIP
jgi:hypothetical protein